MSRILILMLALTITCPASAAEPPKDFTNSIGMKFKLIPAGEFIMGSPEDEAIHDYDETQHRVRITEPFLLGTHEVTVGQFRQFVEDDGYQTEAERYCEGKGGWGYDEAGNKLGWYELEYTWRDTGWSQTDAHPVVNVSWNDAVAFCVWLSRQEGKTYRLPTEAQWEYACRAGTTTRYHNGDDPEELVRVGNVADADAKAKFDELSRTVSARDGYVYTAPVGRFQSNDFDLYDMHGNVWEWCSDWYTSACCENSSTDAPKDASVGSSRVRRGGGWFDAPGDCRSANRGGVSPGARWYDLGFRVALGLVE